jgi:hypothetical protein
MSVFTGISSMTGVSTITNVSTGIVTSGLVLHLDAGNAASYSGSGTTWTDLSGNSNTGTLTNGPTYSSENGGSIVFDGSNDYVNIPNSASLNITSSISFGGWFYPTYTSAYQTLVVKSSGAPRQYGVWFTQSNTSQVYVALIGTNHGETNIALSSPWTVNAWNNLMVVYNTSTSSLIVYLNGVSVASKSCTGNISSTSHAVTIGWHPSEPYKLQGRSSQAVIYNRAISASEVTENYNALRGRYGL